MSGLHVCLYKGVGFSGAIMWVLRHKPWSFLRNESSPLNQCLNHISNSNSIFLLMAEALLSPLLNRSHFTGPKLKRRGAEDCERELHLQKIPFRKTNQEVDSFLSGNLWSNGSLCEGIAMQAVLRRVWSERCQGCVELRRGHGGKGESASPAASLQLSDSWQEPCHP